MKSLQKTLGRPVSDKRSLNRESNEKKPAAVMALLAISLISIATSATGKEILFECGASRGQMYALSGGITVERPKRWQDDQISNGRIALTIQDGEFDIELTDSISPKTLSGDGAAVILLSSSEGKVTVGGFHPNYIEIYTFDPIDKLVVFSQHKTGTLIPKVGLYYAECE